MKGNRAKTYNILTISMISLLTVIAVFVVSCTRDDETHNERAILYPEFISKSMINASTKAPIDNSYVSTLIPDLTIINAYAVNTVEKDQEHKDEELISGYFSKKKSNTVSQGAPEWYSSLEVKGGESYNIYGLGVEGIGQVSDPTYTTTTLSTTIQNVNIATQIDPTIAVATAKNAGSLMEGEYLYENVTTTGDNTDKVYMAMQHLYSQASLYFKIDNDYNTLRTIEITGISISSMVKSGLSIGFEAGQMPSVQWSALSAESNDNYYSFDLPHNMPMVVEGVQTLTDIDYPVVLSNDSYIPAGAFRFAPLLKTADGKQYIPVTITVTYNVYRYELDNQNHPITADTHLIRESVTATNSNLLTFVDPQRNINRTAPAAGYNYPIRITVKPTYLYVLADDDADFKLELEE